MFGGPLMCLNVFHPLACYFFSISICTDAPLPVLSGLKQPPEGDPTRTSISGWEGILSSANKATYGTMFVNAGATHGRLSGAQVEEAMRNSGVSSLLLSKIW